MASICLVIYLIGLNKMYISEKIKYLDTAVKKLDELGIDREDWCVVGSGVLAAHDVRTNNDLDICVRSLEYERLRKEARDRGWPIRNSGTIVVGDLDLVKDEYYILGLDSESLLDNENHFQRFDGIKVARLELEFAKRAFSEREKEKKDISLLEKKAFSSADWDWSLVKSPVHSRKKPLTLKQRIARKVNKVKSSLLNFASILSTPSLWPNKKPKTPLHVSVILWPPASHLFDEIEANLRRNYAIVKTEDITLSQDQFSELVRGVYKLEDIPSWKVERKLAFMKQNQPVVRFLEIVLSSPQWRVQKDTRDFYSQKSHDIKKAIREKYKNEVPGYIHDTIIHTADTFSTSKETKKALDRIK